MDPRYYVKKRQPSTGNCLSHRNSIQAADPLSTKWRPRLLIVNEDPLTRELHSLALNLEGYDFETACDGAAALERLAVEQFDVVVTNRAMPNLDGASMVLALRSAGSKIPIVMISGSLSEAPLPRLVACEISAVAPKPARTNEILSAVAHVLRTSAAHREDLELTRGSQVGDIEAFGRLVTKYRGKSLCTACGVSAPKSQTLEGNQK
jgi:DNA-binding response OmpR family regulator